MLCCAEMWCCSFGLFPVGSRCCVSHGVCCMLHVACFCCLLHVLSSLLHVVCCMFSLLCCTLHAICCTLFLVCCMFSVACCLLHVVCCLLHVICCMLFLVCCTLSVACSMLPVACCMVQVNRLKALCVRTVRLPRTRTTHRRLRPHRRTPRAACLSRTRPTRPRATSVRWLASNARLVFIAHCKSQGCHGAQPAWP